MSLMKFAPIAVVISAALFSASADAQEFSGRAETDNATERRKAINDWWFETKPTKDFRRAMNDAAERERRRYANLMPGSTAGQIAPLFDSNLELAATGTNWLNIGPNNATVIKNGSTTLNNITDAGRPNSIVTTPGNANQIFIAMAGGGVWKTTDGGASWAPKTETLGSLSAGALAMDPNNSNTLYLGMGDAFDGTGLGMYKSTNAGENWSGPVYLGNSTSIRDIYVAPGGSSIVMAATDTGLFRSTDGGASFAQVSLATGFADAPGAWDIEFTGGTSFALSVEATPAATTGTTNGQVFTSTNNGSTWTKASGPTKSTGVGRISLASAPSSRTTVYAMAAIPNNGTANDLADLFKSTNGGGTWTALSATAGSARYSNTNSECSAPKCVLNGQGWYNHALIVNPSNANQFFFGGALHLASATFSGSKWTYTTKSNWLAQYGLPYVHADFHTAAFDSLGTFYVGTDGGIFKSTNNGTTWTDDLNVGITSHLLYSVGSSTNNRSAVVGGFQDNGTRVRSGTTGTYNQYIGGDGFGANVNRANAQQMLGSLYYTRIYKSTNGGTSFATASSGITESNNSASAPFITHIEAWDGDSTGNTVFTHVNAKVYKSTNYATSWTALGVSGLPTTSFAIRQVGVAQSSASNIGIAASGGRVFLTSNGGTAWTQSGALPNNGLSISDVHFDRANPSIIYVASVAPDAAASHLWKSTNGGTSFVAIDGAGFPTGVPVNTVTTDPGAANVVYAGTHLGVYKSTDSGATWTRFGAGMPLVNAMDMYIAPDSSLVRVATFGRGFWELAP
jgi:photosystem II stability/assembly factor-like uncharacterized protein